MYPTCKPIAEDGRPKARRLRQTMPLAFGAAGWAEVLTGIYRYSKSNKPLNNRSHGVPAGSENLNTVCRSLVSPPSINNLLANFNALYSCNFCRFESMSLARW